MNEQFRAECAQFHLSTVAYFELAHRALYGCPPPDIGDDLVGWMCKDTLPDYMVTYLSK